MLRMTVEDDADGRRLIVEGRLTGVWAREAERYWNTLLASRGRVVRVVDVRDVIAIDAAGKALLHHMHRHGVRLVSSGCLINSVVADITQDCRRSGESAGRSEA